MKKIVKIAGAAGALFPVAAFAATSNVGYFTGLIANLTTLVNQLIPFLVGLAVLVIFWGIVRYIISGGDEEKRKEARAYIIWGIIGLFVMVAVWGLVNLLRTSFGLDSTGPGRGDLPSVPGSSI